MDDNALDIILRLQDELTPALVKAQETIRQASADLATHGATGTKAFNDSNEAGRALVETLKEIAFAAGFAFSVEGAVEFVKAIAEEANQLQTLSIQTRISVEDLQVLKAATKEIGVEGDTLGRALFQLQQRIAGNDASVVTAYHLMGMSIDDVKNKNAIDLFLATERGLGMLEGAVRDTAAADLYGGRLGASMVAFATGADEAIAKAKGINVASAESVKATAEYVAAIDRLSASFHGLAIEILGKTAGGINVIADASAKGASTFDIAKAMFDDFMGSVLRGGPHVSSLTALLDGLNQAGDKDIQLTKDGAAGHDKAAVALDAHGKAAAFMATTLLDSGKPLLAWQKDYLDQLDAMGLLDAKNAAGVGVNVQQLEAYKSGLKATADAMRILGDIESEEDARSMLYFTNRLKNLDAVTKANLSAYSFGAQIAAIQQLDAAEQVLAVDVEHSMNSEQERQKVRETAIRSHIALIDEEMAIQLKQKDVVNAAILAEFDAETKLNAEWGLNAAGAIRVQKSALDVLTDKLTELHLKKVEGISQEKEEQVLIDEYTKSLLDEATAQDAVATAVDKTTVATDAAADSMRSFKGTMTLSAASMDDLNAQLETFYRTLAARGPIGNMSGPSAFFSSPFSNPSTTVPTRDIGGDGVAGQPYYIGKGAQPELFIPKTNGTFIPNGMGGISITNHISVTQPLGTPQVIADLIARAQGNSLTARGFRLGPGGIA